MYKKGEDPTTTTSIFWDWSCYAQTPVKMSALKDENSRGAEYQSGEYEMVLFSWEETTTEIARYAFTIVAEETNRVETLPTCEQDGYITVSYEDGTSKVLEGQKAVGHTYAEKGTYNGESTRTHTRVCVTCAEEENCECKESSITEKCTFGEGVVTEEATTEKDGVMTYTCTVCGGTYTEVISKKEVASVVMTTPATCEETGVETTFYTDGSSSEKVIPAVGHAYTETWTFDGEDSNTHSKTCTNDCECEKRTLTEECNFTKEVVNGELLHTCTVCEGSFAKATLTTNKTEYQFGENVVTNAVGITNDSWVGIYDGKVNQNTNFADKSQTKHQERWHYVRDAAEKVYANIPVGNYSVVLFKDGGYEVVKIIYITVTGEKLITTNKKEYFLGEDILVNVSKRENAGEKDWVGFFNILETPNSATPATVWDYVNNVSGTKNLNEYATKKDFTNGMYTLYILADDGYEIIDYINITIWPAIVSVDEEQAPTCEADGWRKVTLADGTNKTITADYDATLKALGEHTYVDKWVYDGEDVKTHSKSCTTCTETCGCENSKLTEECTFDAGAVTEEPALDEPGLMTYTCEICEGTYTEVIPALTVTNTEVILEPECEVEGTLRTYYSDGTYKDTVIDALGHDMGYFIVTTDSTCTEFGEAISECSRCDYYETDVVEKIEHSYVANVTEPTCTEGGYTTYVCDECGDNYKDEETEKLGHKFVNYVSNNDATYEKDGTKTAKCERCDETDTIADEGSKLEPPHHHSYVMHVTEPTCTDGGYTTFICSCGDSFVDHHRDALGHLFKNYVLNKDGTRTAKCERCEETDTVGNAMPTLTDVTRLAGNDRYETAFKVADALKVTLGVEKFDAVIVANGTNFADALAGSYLSSKQNAPILMTDKKDANIQKLVDYIKTNLKADGIVFILGGTAAVSDKVEKQLNGFAIERLAGNDRYETNLAILRRAGGVGYNDLLVCTGTNFADSLSASATGQPMLLVGKKLTARQKVFFMETLPETNVVIVGGEGAVNKTVEKELKKAYENVSRLAGSSRYETSVMVADKYFEKPSYAVVALATNFPDGLSGGALAYALQSPLLLTNGQKVNFSITAKYTNSQNITAGYVLGGNKLVTDEAKDAIFKK